MESAVNTSARRQTAGGSTGRALDQPYPCEGLLHVVGQAKPNEKASFVVVYNKGTPTHNECPIFQTCSDKFLIRQGLLRAGYNPTREDYNKPPPLNWLSADSIWKLIQATQPEAHNPPRGEIPTVSEFGDTRPSSPVTITPSSSVREEPDLPIEESRSPTPVQTVREGKQKARDTGPVEPIPHVQPTLITSTPASSSSHRPAATNTSTGTISSTPQAAPPPVQPVLQTIQPSTGSGSQQPGGNPQPAGTNTAPPMSTQATWKYPTPEPFKNKSDGPSAREFIDQLELFFDWYGASTFDDEKKCHVTLSLCRDLAHKWAQAYLHARTAKAGTNAAGTTVPLSTEVTARQATLKSWEAFKKEFLAQFSSIDEVRSATEAVSRLRHSGPIATYAAEFRQLAAQTEWNEASKIAMFRAHLNARTLDQIALAADEPSGYEAFVNWVIKLAERSEDRQSHIKPSTDANRSNQRNNGGRFRPRRTGNNNRNTGQYGVHNGNQSNRLSQQDRESYIKDNRCFICGKVGHISTDANFHPGRNNPAGGTRPSGPSGAPPRNASMATPNYYERLENEGEERPLTGASTSRTPWQPPWNEFEDVDLPDRHTAAMTWEGKGRT